MVFTLFAVPASAAGGLVGAAKSFVEWSIKTQNSVNNAFWKLVFGENYNSATPDQLNTAYTDYVTALPATGLTSSGSLLWYPTIANCSSFYHEHSSSYNSYTSVPQFPCSLDAYNVRADVTSPNPRTISLKRFPPESKSSFSLYWDGFKCYVKYPLAGSYRLFPSDASSYSLVTINGVFERGSDRFSLGSSFSYRAAGSSCELNFRGYKSTGVDITVASINYYLPVYEFIPDIAVDTSPGGSYSNDTRTGSLSGNFGYTGPDGTMITAENIKIVNETTNTLFNPVTNTTTNFKDWTYDYSTRTYNVTLDTGTKQTITYGDENVTIKEGDTIYNIYYVTPDGGTPPPKPPGTCVHDYVPAVTKAPTCLLPGVKTLTCSKCQDAYTENIPATGHSWTVKETVNTTYDAAGVLLKQGYTIFKCSICGEEYKDSSGAGPPGGGGGGESGKPSIWDKLGSLLGSAANGFITVLKTAVIKILDALVAMFDAINTKLASVTTAIFGLFDRIPQLFGGFTGFLSAVFPFFPPEVFDILTLSILILAAATLIKFFLKR